MRLRRRLSIGSWAIISFLLLSFAAAAVSLLAPIFFENLLEIVVFIAAQPSWPNSWRRCAPATLNTPGGG